MGGGRNFGPHIRTQVKVEYPPGINVPSYIQGDQKIAWF